MMKDQVKDIINKSGIETLLDNFKDLIVNCQITHTAIPFLMKKLEINIIMIKR